MVDQHPQCGLAVFGDVGDERVAGEIELAGAVGFECEHGTKAGGIGSREQVPRRTDRISPGLLREDRRGPWRRLLSRRE